MNRIKNLPAKERSKAAHAATQARADVARDRFSGDGHEAKTPPQDVRIAAPRMRLIELTITGTAPYVQCRFPQKAMDAMKAKHRAGQQAKKGAKREPRDFDADYQGAFHRTEAGWCGIPAGSFRAAMVSACKLCGFHMTKAKLALFIEADGFDVVDGTPLIRIEGKPTQCEMAVRNATGVCDIRVRPMWRSWSATVRIRFDEDQLSIEDVCNLMSRVGMQVGIGEGRPDSRDSCGMGWGLFRIEGGGK